MIHGWTKSDIVGRLEKQRQTLLEMRESARDSSAAVELDQTKVGRLSRMDAMERQAMAKATDARRKNALKRNESAMERLEEGEYGYCIKCGEDIAEKRLLADPSEPQCVDCARGG